jgi:hypothetical protein
MNYASGSAGAMDWDCTGLSLTASFVFFDFFRGPKRSKRLERAFAGVFVPAQSGSAGMC